MQLYTLTLTGQIYPDNAIRFTLLFLPFFVCFQCRFFFCALQNELNSLIMWACKMRKSLLKYIKLERNIKCSNKIKSHSWIRAKQEKRDWMMVDDWIWKRDYNHGYTIFKWNDNRPRRKKGLSVREPCDNGKAIVMDNWNRWMVI